MLKHKITVISFSSIAMFVVSFACGAADTIWKQSHKLEAEEKYEEAAAAIEPAVADNNEYALLRYAYLKYKQGEYNDSIKYYEKAMKLNPKSADAKLGLTLPYIAQGRWRQVKLRSRQVLLKSEGNYTAHERLMRAEDGSKKWHSLGRHADKVMLVFPSDATTLVYHARAKARFGDTRVAVASYKKVLMRDPDNAEAIEYLEQNK